MDPIISLGEKNTLAECMTLSGADNCPPMLDKDLYDYWKSRMELYMQNREHGKMILESVENDPLIWPTVEDNGVIRTKKYTELSAAEKIQADCDMKATNIILQGFPDDIYSLVNQHRVAKDLWERVQLLMQGTSLTKQEREFNTKFLNSLPPDWSMFVTDVKLVKDLHTSNFDQLHAYLKQHELYANEVRFAIPVFSSGDDPIACLNKAMAFLTAVSSSRFPSTNNQLRTSSNPRKQATIQDVRVTVQQARVAKCYNCQGKRHMARQCTQPKRPRNTAWYKEKAMVAEAQEVGQILDEEQLTEDLDTYDSDSDDLSTAQGILMANLSNYGSDIISEIKPTLYDGAVISKTHVAMPVIDDEETLILEEESRSKLFEKAKDPEVIAKKIFHKPIDYEKLNSLIEDFETRFSPQQELSAEQAFWFHTFNPTIEPSYSPLVIVDVPSELPKVSLVNASLKKIKFHLTWFDSVVKRRTTPSALKEDEWGFEHTKAIFNNEIIPFLKSLKDIFNVFYKDLLNEITKVQTVFDQMEASVQQFLIDKKCLEIAKK
ncbi:hypothetical protein Tco_0004624 [Tanacetum coccineum]